jgi:glycosyltransferase involved in cell wall biosynthesis
MAHNSTGIMEENIQGLTERSRINLMALIVSMPVGGVETQLLSILGRLNKDRYNVSICCIKDAGTLGEKAAEAGIKMIALNLMKSNRFSLGIARQISRTVREHDIHILWTHQYVANLYGRIALLTAETPAVISNFHALYDNPKIHRRLFNRLLSGRTDIMVAVSDAVAADMKIYDRVSAEKIKVIHNGIDLSVFDIAASKADCRKKLGLPEDDIIVGTIGRLSKEKNHKVIIDALIGMPAGVKGLIIGDGPLRKVMEEAGGDRFYFTGQMEYNVIPLALNAMDIFCSSSLWEGFGMAVVEAMASGLPIVASDIPSHREVLGEAGLFFPAENAGSLAKVLNMIMDDASLRGSLAGKAKGRAELFSIDKTVAAYDRLFRTITKHDVS